jgi:DivIVA domain-containing protein
MALDFQRPDPSSPAAVASAQFTVTRRGYREEEVRDFLRQVSVELGRLIERERFLENELKAVAARSPVDVSAIDEAAVAELLGAEAARVLSAAREAAQAMRDRAAESAEHIVREASREATRLLEESNLEASRRRTDVSSEAEQEIELAKQQGREMVAEVRAYRERVLTDVAKRTEEARRELERLVHERERLLGAFERARLTASDVVGDLNEFDQAIRDSGIVPPLVPPDAPPPPRPTRKSDTPIFDAKQYEDELGTAQEPQVPREPQAHQHEVAEVPASAPESPASETPTATTTDASRGEVDGDNQTAAEPAATAVERTAAAADAAIAPVVSIFEGRRKKAVTTDAIDSADPAESDSSASPTESSLSANPANRARSVSAHPVFEHVEAAPETSTNDAEPTAHDESATGPLSTGSLSTGPLSPELLSPRQSGTPTSQVDDIFARLRRASTRRVAKEAEEDLQTATTKSKEKKAALPDDATPPSGAQPPKDEPEPARNVVRPASVDPSVFRRRDEAIGSVLESLVRTVKRLLADDENALLTHVGGKRTSLVPADMLPRNTEHAARYAEAMRDSVTSIAVEGARSITDSRRADLRMTIGNGAVHEAVVELLVRDFIRPLHERIASEVDAAGGEREALTKQTRALFAEWRSRRAAVVVTDVANLAYARGLFLACDAQGQVCWAVDPNGPPCADGEDNALAGAMRHGEKFPTGHAHPLAHAGCRCLVIPHDK